MSTTRPADAAARVADAVPRGTRPLLAIDHDGTLSTIAPRPEEATLVAGAAEVLRRLSAHAEVAIVSGRGLDDLHARIDVGPVSLVSEHGLRCRRPDGHIEELTDGLAPEMLERLRTELRDLLADRPGWIVEDKGVAIAVHHRLVPSDSLQPLLDQVRGLLETAAALPGRTPQRGSTGPGGEVQTGKAVLELRPRGADKGAALRWLAARTDARPVVMVGDDATDEPALRAAEEVGGFGILVSDQPRDTAASVRLEDPAAVVRFLEELADRLMQGR